MATRAYKHAFGKIGAQQYRLESLLQVEYSSVAR